MAYASTGDLEARWRPLSTAEKVRAEVLLDDASSRVRRLYRQTDARITSGDLDASEVVAIVCSMVRRVMATPDGTEGVRQQSQTQGPFSLSQQFDNPMGNLYLTADEKAVLAVKATRSAFSVPLWQG